MKRLAYAIVMASFALFLAACMPPKSVAGKEDANSASLLQLHDTRWMVHKVAGEDIPQGMRIDMNFGQDGHLSGTSGCNRYFATYEASKNNLTIHSIAGTKMFCMGGAMKTEQAFLALLQETKSFHVDGAEKLTLLAENGGKIQAIRSTGHPQAAPK